MALRLLLVHAHPDDESLNHGTTVAAAVAMGHDVDVVTCTRGEEGEVIGTRHAHRVSSRDDTLGEHREVELAAALAALATPVPETPRGDNGPGRLGHHWLDTLPSGQGLADTPARYRDTGMVVRPGGRAALPRTVHQDAFAVADLHTAASRLAGLIRRTRPHVVATYGPDGGYGHPDHVMTHRVTVRALTLADEHWRTPWVYGVVADVTALRTWLRDRGDPAAWDPDGPLPQVYVPPEQIDATVRAEPWLPAKVAALTALPSQVTVLDSRPGHAAFALSDGVAQPLLGREQHRLLRGVPDRARPVMAGELRAARPDDPVQALIR